MLMEITVFHLSVGLGTRWPSAAVTLLLLSPAHGWSLAPARGLRLAVSGVLTWLTAIAAAGIVLQGGQGWLRLLGAAGLQRLLLLQMKQQLKQLSKLLRANTCRVSAIEEHHIAHHVD